MSNRIKSLRCGLLFVAVLALRCATATNGRYQRIPVTSEPPGASVTVSCGPGSHAEGVTPTNIVVRRKAELCLISVVEEGYQPESVSLQRRRSARTLGNFVVPVAGGTALALAMRGWGGTFGFGALLTLPVAAALIGVDYGTGAVYEQAPGEVHVSLRSVHP